MFLQRLPSGEVNLTEDDVIISTNSNDQIAFYSLAEVLEKPMFDEEFGEIEFEFKFDLMPYEIFGIFTWKPFVATHNKYTAVEWNSGIESILKN